MVSLRELLPPLLGNGNDWTPFEEAVKIRFPQNSPPAYSLPVSIVIPVYNRKKVGENNCSPHPLHLSPRVDPSCNR